MFMFARAHNVDAAGLRLSHEGPFIESACVSEKWACGSILQRAPSAVPANRKLPCILTVSHGCVCFCCSHVLLKPPRKSTDLFLSFLTSHLLLHPFPLLLVPGWASLLDQTGRGVVLLWRSGSSRRSPVYCRLFIQPPCHPCPPN